MNYGNIDKYHWFLALFLVTKSRDLITGNPSLQH